MAALLSYEFPQYLQSRELRQRPRNLRELIVGEIEFLQIRELHQRLWKRRERVEGDKDAKDDAAVLDEWLKLSEREADLKKRLKEADAALDAKAYAQYPKLTEVEIQTLAVDDKWLVALDVVIHREMDRISQSLTHRVKEMSERYDTPMPQMVTRAVELEAKVNRHLERMGFSWS